MGSRILAGAWFGTVALVCSSALYLAPASARGAAEVVLFVVLPTVSGTAAGATVGAAILDRRRTRTIAVALFRGVMVTCSAFLILAMLFTAGYAVVAKGTVQPFGIIVGVLSIGLLATG